MSKSGGGFLGKLLTFFLGMIFGIIVLVGGLAGGAYWAYSKVKISTIEKKIKTELVGEDYKDLSIKEFVSKLGGIGTTMTIGEIEKVFKILEDVVNNKYPDGEIPLNLSGDTALGKINLDAIRAQTFKKLISNESNVFNDILIITATLRTVEGLGLSFPDFPAIKGGGAGNEVYSYTLATGDDFSIKKSFEDLAFENFYIQEKSFEPVTVDGGNITGKYRYFDEIYRSDQITILDNSNGQVNDNPPLESLYVLVESYNAAAENEIGTRPLYVKTDGILDLPLIDGFNALNNLFDLDSLTFGELQANFGISFDDNFILDKIKDVPISKLSQGIDDQIKNVELKDIIKNDDNSHLINALLYDNGDPINGTPVKVGEIADRIDALILGDILEIHDDSPKILKELQACKIDELPLAIDNLKIKQMTDIPTDNNILNALKNAPLQSLPAAVDQLLLQEVIGSDAYDVRPATQGDLDDVIIDGLYKTFFKKIDGVYVVIKNDDLFDFDDGILQPEYQDLFDEDELYVGEIKAGVWRYMLTENGEEIEIQINNLAAHMEIVATNIGSSTLRDLKTNNILDLADDSIFEEDPLNGGTLIGDMTISEALDTFAQVISMLP